MLHQGRTALNQPSASGREYRKDGNVKGWKKKQLAEKPSTIKSILAYLATYVLGILSALLIPMLSDRFSLTDSRLVHAGPPPLAPRYTEVKALPNGMMEYYVKLGVRLRNNGWRRGHVDKVELARNGLKAFPERVTVLHVDKTDIGWLEERTVEFEFIALVKPFPEKTKAFQFSTTFLGPTGNQIYREFTNIEVERMN